MIHSCFSTSKYHLHLSNLEFIQKQNKIDHKSMYFVIRKPHIRTQSFESYAFIAKKKEAEDKNCAVIISYRNDRILCHLYPNSDFFPR